MNRPSKEIIENAALAASRDDEYYDAICSGFFCTAEQCPFIFENGIACNGVGSDRKFFKDFLAKYDIEERIDMGKEKEIAEIKARIARLERKKDTYPCIKMHKDGMVVLFTKPKSGIVLYSNSGDYDIGYQCGYWAEDNFTETLTEYTVKV